MWNKTYGGVSSDWASSLTQAADSFVLVGLTSSFGLGSEDYWLVKTDTDGNYIWNSTYGSTNEDIGSSAIVTDNGGYAIAGWTCSFGAGNADFWLIKLASEMVPATVDIDPNTLNLWSNGNWITAYIELPEGYDVSGIDVSTVKLNETIAAELYPTSVGDENGDGIPDVMVKFDRAAVTEYIMMTVDSILLAEWRGVTITLTVTGNLDDGTAFEGSDTIRVMCRGGGGIGKHARMT